MRSILCTSIVCALLTACAMPSFDVQPRYTRSSIDGSAGFSSGAVGGSADVAQAGLDEDTGLGARVDFKFGSPHLIGLAQAPHFVGSGTLDTTISDGTNTITAGTAVDSEIELGIYDAALVFDLVPGDMVEVGIGFGAAYLDTSLRFADPGTGTIVESEEKLPIPLVCATASVWIGPVQVGAFGGGMSVSDKGDSVDFLDADLYARWKLFGGDELLRGSLVVGYRLTKLQLDYADNSTNVSSDLTIDGPYVGLEVSL